MYLYNDIDMLTRLKLQIVVGSTRQGRHADAVLKWLIPVVEAHSAFASEVLDLRECPLPMFQEVVAKMGDLRSPTFSDPVVQRWNARIQEADAYLIVTPDHNHSIPAVLKNAIDSVFFTDGFRHKPVAFIGYSLGVAAARARGRAPCPGHARNRSDAGPHDDPDPGGDDRVRCAGCPGELIVGCQPRGDARRSRVAREHARHRARRR